MSIKHLTQIVLAIVVSIATGLFSRQFTQHDNCNRAALNAVLDGGHLVLPNDCVLLMNPSAEIKGNVIIEGGILHGNGVDRVLIIAESATVLLSNTVIVSGSIEIEPANGGGIYNAGTLVIENSRVTANSAQQGGGIYNASTGHLTIVNSEITHNRAREGGGIYNRGLLLMEGTDIIENSVQSLDNYGGYGAGIVNKGQAGIVFSIIANNRGDGEGIGIDTSGRLIVRQSVIMNNQCTVADCRATGILRFEGYVDAKYNYWGSPDGPGGEGPGTGDTVIGLAESCYTPFLTQIPDWAE